MVRHRPLAPDPAMPQGVVRKALNRNVFALAVANGGTGVAFLTDQPGKSASLLWLATVFPLPAWGVVYLMAAVLLGVRKPLPAHWLAVPCWLMWGVGAVLGLASGSSSSPTGSIALTGMVLAVAGMHCGGLVYRRDERQAWKAQTSGGA